LTSTNQNTVNASAGATLRTVISVDLSGIVVRVGTGTMRCALLTYARRPVQGETVLVLPTRSGPVAISMHDVENLRVFSPNYIVDATTIGPADTIYFPMDCTITEVYMVADVVGTLEVDIETCDYASYPSGFASICNGTVPIILGADKSHTLTTDWDRDILAGTFLRFNILQATTITRATVSPVVERV
jgi:hypothetical protein